MGINSLLKTLKDITKRKHLNTYSGMKIGIDGHCWLHKALIFAGNIVLKYYPESDLKLLIKNGIENNELFIKKVVQFIDSQLNKFIKFNIHPIMVFDGDKPTIKHREIARRSENREKIKRYINYLFETNINKCKSKIIESSKITTKIVEEVCKHLIKKKIEYIISPYESDPQLAYLYHKQYIDLIYSEDSDLLVYGCKLVIFKLDKTNTCDELRIDMLNSIEDFKNWNFDMFREFCVLCGCDYFKMRGIGSKMAYKIINRFGSFDAFVEEMKEWGPCSMLNLASNPRSKSLISNINLDNDTIKDFKMAMYTFGAQIVLDPESNKCSNINNLNIKYS